MDGEGHPVDVAAVKLVADADTLMLSSDGTGKLKRAPDEEAPSDSIEELGLEPCGVGIELGFFGNDIDGPVVNVKELEPGTPEESVISALLVAETGDELALGDNEPDESRGPVVRGGMFGLGDISLRIESAHRSLHLEFVSVLTLSSRRLGLKQTMTQQFDSWSARWQTPWGH